MTTEAETSLPLTGETRTSILAQGEFQWFTVTETGMSFKAATPKEVWLETTTQLADLFQSTGQAHAKTMFMLGDALRQGKLMYGEEYAQVIDSTSKYMQLSVKTLENVMSVTEHVPLAVRRVETLTLEHHKAVQKLSEADQERFLKAAEEGNWSVSALKKEVTAEFPPARIKKKKNAVGAEPNKLIVDLNDPEGIRHAAEHVSRYLEAEERFTRDQWDLDTLKMWEPILKSVVRTARRVGVISNGHKKKE